jgi:hypothetical protein
MSRHGSTGVVSRSALAHTISVLWLLLGRGLAALSDTRAWSRRVGC